MKITWWFGENSARIVPIDPEPISNIPQEKEEMGERFGQEIDKLVGAQVSTGGESADGQARTATCQENLDGKVFLETMEALGFGKGRG
jgi:hypothetical protein